MWTTYATVKPQDVFILENLDEGAKHALGSIWRPCLQADLLKAS